MEANGGFVYKMAVNPRADTPNTRFFLQAYEKAENGKLFPRDVLYIGTEEQCRALLGRLSAGELTQEQVKNYYIHGEEPKIRYYQINEAAAERAKRMNSFSDYVPGSATSGYRQMVNEAIAIAEKQKARVDPMYYDKIDYLVDLYARKLAENLNQANAIDARVPSILISGGSNFPVRKKEKQNAARDKNMGEFMYIQGLLNKIRSTGMGGISADDRQAVEKLEAKLDGLKAEQEHMKIVNAYYRKHKTLEGCPGLTPEGVLELQASMSRDWRKKPVPYEDNRTEQVEIVSLPCPIFEDGEKLVMQRGVGVCTVKSTPEREKACMTFLKWLTEPERNADFVTSLGYMPVTKEGFDRYLPAAIETLSDPMYVSLYEAFLKTRQDYTFYVPPQREDYLNLETHFEKAVRLRLAAGRAQYLEQGADALEPLLRTVREELQKSYGK